MTEQKGKRKKKERTKARVGRPTKITEELSQKIINAIKLGAYVETAVSMAGVSKSTFYNWNDRGNRELERVTKIKGADAELYVDDFDPREYPFVEFLDAINEALALSEVRDLSRIDRAAETQWQAAAWKLERKNPERWGKRMTVDGELKGGSVEIIIANEPDDEIDGD